MKAAKNKLEKHLKKLEGKKQGKVSKREKEVCIPNGMNGKLTILV
jgi:hypothetical protein